MSPARFNTRVFAQVLLLGLLPVGCGSREVAKPAGVAASRDSTADMPGMDMGKERPDSTVVRFTAAQVQHGGIEWALASASKDSRSMSTAILPGQLVPNEDRTARLGAPAQGRVMSVRVNPGEKVRSGEVLLTLQSPEAGMAQSDLAKATAQLTSSRAQLSYASSARARAERLLALKAVPRQEYERTQADEESAKAELSRAEAELHRASSTAVALGATGGTSGELSVRTPLGGVVLARLAVPGTVVEAGAPLIVITDPSSLWLTLSAPETLSGLLHVGTPVRFVVPAYPADTFSARLSVVGAGLDPQTRSLDARAVIGNSAGRFKPAMLATVLLPSPARPPAGGSGVTVPADAVQSLDGVSTVFVAMPDGKGGAAFTARAVVVETRAPTEAVITRGIAAGDLVVVKGAFAVKAQIKKGASPKMVM